MSTELHAQLLDKLVSCYKGDSGAKGSNRILRIPGFVNWKYGKPELVTLEKITGDDYKIEEIVAAFLPGGRKRGKSSKRSGSVLATLMPERETSPEEVRSMLEALPAEWWEPRENWRVAGCSLHHWSDGSDKGYELWCEYASVSDKFKEKDSRRVEGKKESHVAEAEPTRETG
jgi:hypothetical protein